MDKMRLASIDIFRALTMLLMIWVNDFWSLKNIPKWLEHASATEDYMGFSDVIFPLFLFIVGLSIPLAIENRLKKGDSRNEIGKHILIRTLSLLFIGFYMVNAETIHQSTSIGMISWRLLMAAAIGLIWMNWKRSPIPEKWHRPLQLLGWIIFALLAYSYKGGEDGAQWMQPQWWGILGLIGWAYGLNAFIYLFSQGKMNLMIALWLALILLSVISHSDYAFNGQGFIKHFSALYTGTIPAFTAAGVVATLLLVKFRENKAQIIHMVFIVIGLGCIVLGLLSRPIWGISKIQATPSWLGICTGIGFLGFSFLFFLADQKQRTSWAKVIAPAGTATLTCYMLPYFIYPFYSYFGWKLPKLLNSGILGLSISMCFAFLVVILTGLLEKKGFKLKL